MINLISNSSTRAEILREFDINFRQISFCFDESVVPRVCPQSYSYNVTVQKKLQYQANLARNKDEICAKFGEYGKNLGIAFQIIDDILDITQNSILLGKPAMNDYKEGKTTLPYIYLYRVLDKADKEKLKSFYKKSLNDDEILWLRTKFDEYNIIARAKNEAKDYGTKALQSIKDFKNEKLENIVKTMIYRDF